MSVKVKFINIIVLLIALVWSALMLAIIATFIYHNYEYADTLAKSRAVTNIKKDLAYRLWVASHGGIYVPITENTPPNPYLSHIENRDVNTSASQTLTLLNPSYALSQMMSHYSKLYGEKSHITSRILTNPANKADSWEDQALRTTERTREPVYTKAYIGNKEYFRYLNPLVVEKDCMKCHAHQGYKVGDIRGGVSVSILMEPYYEEAFSHSMINVLAVSLIYLIGLGTIFYGRKKAKEIIEKKIKDYEQHIFSLVNIIEKRDSYTAGHTQRVAKYSVLIAQEMGFNEETVDELYRACMLHDIGKISTPDTILLKPGKLSVLEYAIIKEHVVVSYELLKEVDIYKDIAEIVRHHHEHYDGSGYPQGLKGDEIPMLAQIMIVTDAFDAMTTNRIYKAKKSVDLALHELEGLSAKQFNPQIVKYAVIALSGVAIEDSITQLPVSKIEKERFSYFYKDQLTGVYNRDYLEFVLAYSHIDEFIFKCAYEINLRHFTQYNKKHGWVAGDALLASFASELKNINDSDFVFRLYGDDFILLNKEHYEIEDKMIELKKILKDSDVTLTYKHFDINELHIKNIMDLEMYL